jgi:hypothetical protein
MAVDLFRRREPFLWLTGIVGLIVILGYWFNVPIIQTLYTEVTVMGKILFFFYLVLGLLTQYRHHLLVINERRMEPPPNWMWSVYFLVIMTLTVVVAGGLGVDHPLTDWIITYPQRGVSLGTSALYGPFLFLAILRSVNLRNWTIGVMIGVMVLIWMFQAPLWNMLLPWTFPLGEWISTVPSAGASRGYDLSVAIASVVVCVRILTGRESGYLGRE